jgi:hypothetical protein
MLRFLTTATSITVLVAPLPAQQILGIGIGGDVNLFDPQTGAQSFLGSSGIVYGNWSAMTMNSQGRVFASNGYWNLPYRIYELDIATGQALFICQTDLNGIGGLAFDSTDRLFAANDRTAPSIPHPFDLHEIDLGTGATQLIGAMGVTGLVAIDVFGGQAFGYDVNLGLVSIDLGSGAVTDVNSSFRGPLDLAESICFGPDGQLFQVDAGLWVMDTLTAVPCFVGLTGYPGFIVGIEYLDGPGRPFTLGTLGETGGPMGLEVWGTTPQAAVAFLHASGGSGPTPVGAGLPCAGTLLDLNAGVQLAAVAQTDAQGHARLGPVQVPAAAAGLIRLQALDLTACRASNLARLVY